MSVHTVPWTPELLHAQSRGDFIQAATILLHTGHKVELLQSSPTTCPVQTNSVWLTYSYGIEGFPKHVFLTESKPF